MGQDCHRCASPLATPETFCPTCGAPQLRYEIDSETANGNPQTTLDAVREVRWKQAIGAAVTFAVPVGVLCSPVVPILSAGCCLWVLGGAIAAVALYQRRSGSSVLSRQVGSRIGLIIGVLAATVAAAFNAGSLLVQRYLFHAGEAMDKTYQASMEQGSVMAAQLSNLSAAQSQEAIRFWLTPDGRAVLTLLTALLTSIGITVFSAIGGALGSRIFSGRNPALRNT
jgi:hypothetical protein